MKPINDENEIEIESFLFSLRKTIDDSELKDLCRRKVLHGIPFIFKDQEDLYYEFRKRIASKFDIDFYEVFITGSAKLGFSPHKRKSFDYDSDIDIAIVSLRLYDKILDDIYDFQMELRKSRQSVSYKELEMYHAFLEYTAIGWIRPDKLPISFRFGKIKQDWFYYFNSISYKKSEVGDYKVSAGIFKTYRHLEQYTVSGFQQLKKSLEIEYVKSNQTISN